MNISQLRAIVAVSETGSFTKASEKLLLTQSSVSQSVSALETMLDVKLINRSRSRATLSAAGEIVVRHAIDALSLIDQIKDDVASETRRGHLRIASIPSGFSAVLPPLIRRFRDRYPGIDVTPVEADDREVESWLSSGTVDLGILSDPAPGHDAICIGKDEWVAVFPGKHELARRQEIELSLLSQYPFVTVTFGCTYHARILATDHGHEMDVQVETRSLESGLTMVREGLGIAVVPELALINSDLDGLVLRRLNPSEPRSIGLVVSQSNKTNLELAKLLADIAEDYCRYPSSKHSI